MPQIVFSSSLQAHQDKCIYVMCTPRQNSHAVRRLTIKKNAIRNRVFIHWIFVGVFLRKIELHFTKRSLKVFSYHRMFL